MNHSLVNGATMPTERITVVVESTKAVKEIADELADTNERSSSATRNWEELRSQSASRGERPSKKSMSNSERRSQSSTRERSNQLVVYQKSPRSHDTEPDLVISVGDRDFHYFSPVIANMSDYLSQQMVQIEDGKLRIDFSHKNADEWEQYIFPFLQKHSKGKRASKNSFPCVNQTNIAIVLPWFQELGMQALLRDCDEYLASLPFVTPAVMAGFSSDQNDYASGQDVRDAISLLNIAFSCTLPQTQARAADLVHKYLQHSPKTWLLLDEQAGIVDEGEEDDEDNLSIFVLLAQVLQEHPTCREFLFARYNPNMLELYLPPEIIPCDKDSQSDWFWEELVTNPLFPYLLRERMTSVVRQIEEELAQLPEPPVEEPTPEPAPPVVEQQLSILSWQGMMSSWFPSMQQQPQALLSPPPTDDEMEEEEDDDDDDEDDDASLINERSLLIHEVLDKIREPQHNFPRRARPITTLITSQSRRQVRKLNVSVPPHLPVLHESIPSYINGGGDGTVEAAATTPVRLFKPIAQNAESGSPGSTASTDILSLSSGSATMNSRRTFAC